MKGLSHAYNVFILPQTPFPSRLAHNNEQSSMCYTIGFCVVCEADYFEVPQTFFPSSICISFLLSTSILCLPIKVSLYGNLQSCPPRHYQHLSNLFDGIPHLIKIWCSLPCFTLVLVRRTIRQHNYGDRSGK